MVMFFAWSGEADVLQTFMIDEGKRQMPVAGCRCRSGMLSRKKLFKLMRYGQTVYEGQHHSVWVNDRGTRHLWNQNRRGCRPRQFRLMDDEFQYIMPLKLQLTMKALL